jgi:hypothetical protein
MDFDPSARLVARYALSKRSTNSGVPRSHWNLCPPADEGRVVCWHCVSFSPLRCPGTRI